MDIQQGSLGDCYFLSVLSVLTEKPHRVKKLFVSDQVISEGIFAVKMTKNGESVEVIVDDYFPCKNKRPVFSKANGNELWVLILEKAWAKLHGSYDKIIGGQCHETFRDVTGAPAWEFESSEEDAWHRIYEAD